MRTSIKEISGNVNKLVWAQLVIILGGYFFE